MTSRYFLRVASARIAARRRYFGRLRGGSARFSSAAINRSTQDDSVRPSFVAACSASRFISEAARTAIISVFTTLLTMLHRDCELTNVNVYLNSGNVIDSQGAT